LQKIEVVSVIGYSNLEFICNLVLGICDFIALILNSSEFCVLMEKIVIIGGGGTGAAIAHDLVLRGFKVSLFERGEFLSGTTGRHHGLLHSGARYAVHDPSAARECIQENKILRQIAPEAIESNDGLFVALDEADLAYKPKFLENCRSCGIQTREINARQAIALEPELNPNLKSAVQVPDATMDAWRLPLHFFATARVNGARIHNFSEVVGFYQSKGAVTGIRIFDHQNHHEYDVHGDLFINAAGAWAGKIGAMAGIKLSILPGPGVMVAVNARLTNMIINRLHKAGEGDILVPQRRLTILGTSIWLADDPDLVTLPRDHEQKIIDLCSRLVPAVNNTKVHSTWYASRPLMAGPQTNDPYAISRDFECVDHQDTDNLAGLISVIGGKATTLRLMAEKTADLICRLTGRDVACKTKTTKLLNYRHFYK
jgi:glycerol-3-phosphate dehydrogenase